MARPLVAWAATLPTDLTRGERGFIGGWPPRGIIAAATASTFGPALSAAHVDGAQKILPVTFLVIVLTVTLYSLTAVPVARRLGVTRPALDAAASGLRRSLGDRARRGATVSGLGGAPVGRSRRRSAARSGRRGSNWRPANYSRPRPEAVRCSRGSRWFSCSPARTTSTRSPRRCCRATSTVRSTGCGPSCPAMGSRPPTPAVRPGSSAELTRPAVIRRHQGGARVVARPWTGPLPAGSDVLFVIRADGRLVPVTGHTTPEHQHGDVAVLLEPRPAAPRRTAADCGWRRDRRAAAGRDGRGAPAGSSSSAGPTSAPLDRLTGHRDRAGRGHDDATRPSPVGSGSARPATRSPGSYQVSSISSSVPSSSISNSTFRWT